MSPIAQLPTSPSKFNVFMEKFAWPTVTLTIGTVLAAVMIAIWLGKIQVINFDWLVLVLVGIMLGITVFFVWYSIRTKQKLQEQYKKDIADIKRNVQTFKNDYRRIREEETHHWNEWAVSFSQASAKEQTERLEEVKKQLAENIRDAENRMDSKITSAQSIFSSSVQSYKVAVDSYKDYLFQTMKRMDTLEERLPESKE